MALYIEDVYLVELINRIAPLVGMNSGGEEKITLQHAREVLAAVASVVAPDATAFPAGPELIAVMATCRERRAAYGPSEVRFGEIMLAMFPEGLTLRTREDWIRYGIFHQLVSKLSRYCKDFHAPHLDSSHDFVGYGAMLAAEDRKADGHR